MLISRYATSVRSDQCRHLYFWLYRQRHLITPRISDKYVKRYFSLSGYGRRLNLMSLRGELCLHTVCRAVLFVCLLLSSSSPPAAWPSHYLCWCAKRLYLDVCLFLCPFVCVSHTHLCLTSHRDQWSRAAIPRHEGRAAQVPSRKLRCLQIRHQPPEQVRVITWKLCALRHA